MKRVYLTLIICCLSSCFAFSQNRMGTFSLSGNINYGTKIESLGIGLRGQYCATNNLRGSAEYKYYIDRHNLSAWGFSFDGHYLLDASSAVVIYPLAGISLTRWTNDPSRSDSDGPKVSDNRLGLNIGIGTQIATGDKTYIQIEAKEALIKDFSQFVISVGFMYQF